MKSTLAPVASLLTGVLFLIIGHGLQLTVVPLRAEAEGWTGYQIGAIGSAYYLGFVGGCFLAPYIIRRSGHIRAAGTLQERRDRTRGVTLRAASLVSLPAAWFLSAFRGSEAALRARRLTRSRGTSCASRGGGERGRMSLVGIIVAVWAFVTVTAIAVILVIHSSKLKEELGAALDQSSALRTLAEGLQGELQERSAEQEALAAENRHIRAENGKKDGWLQNLEQENAHLNAELDKRPRSTRRPYRILTLGVKYTGKTSLTLKWANPLVDLGTLKGTKIERYERTVSHVLKDDTVVEHVFEIGDWGGEHLVDAQQELIMEEIHGMLLVVDLAGRDSKMLDPARIEEQLRAFQPHALQYFFGAKTLACCKTVVLFINKSDVLSGTPAEVEKEAMGYYKKLIDDLEQYRMQIDVRVFVGSASYGHSTHHLFAHFVERILPRSAYDPQLLQRMKAEAEATRPIAGRLNGKPGIKASEVTHEHG